MFNGHFSLPRHFGNLSTGILITSYAFLWQGSQKWVVPLLIKTPKLPTKPQRKTTTKFALILYILLPMQIAILNRPDFAALRANQILRLKLLIFILKRASALFQPAVIGLLALEAHIIRVYCKSVLLRLLIIIIPHRDQPLIIVLLLRNKPINALFHHAIQHFFVLILYFLQLLIIREINPLFTQRTRRKREVYPRPRPF